MEGLGRSCLWLRRELSPAPAAAAARPPQPRALRVGAHRRGAERGPARAAAGAACGGGAWAGASATTGATTAATAPAPVLLYDQGGAGTGAEAEAEEWEADSASWALCCRSFGRKATWPTIYRVGTGGGGRRAPV